MNKAEISVVKLLFFFLYTFRCTDGFILFFNIYFNQYICLLQILKKLALQYHYGGIFLFTFFEFFFYFFVVFFISSETVSSTDTAMVIL